MENTSQEQWRSITGYDGIYEVSNLGRVRSLDRWVRYKNGRVQHYPGTIKTLHEFGGCVGNRYHSVALSRNARLSTRYVHHLVAEEFIGPRPVGHDVCHNDNSRKNNNVLNLRYDTRAGNFADKHAAGTIPTDKNNILDVTDVRLIRTKLDEGMKGQDIAALFKVTPSTISQIKTGRIWSRAV